VAPRAKGARIRDGRGERGGNHRADARNLGQRSADRIGASHHDQAPVEAGGLGLELSDLGDQQLQQLAGHRRDAVVLERAEGLQQLAQTGLTLRRDDPELGQGATQPVDGRRPLTDQLVAHPVQHQARLLGLGLDRHEAHARPLHGFAAGLGIGGIVLVGLDPCLAPSADHRGRRGAARLDILGRHETRLVPKRAQLAGP
jgi:hypothetical protein